jgi:hypothetical protein
MTDKRVPVKPTEKRFKFGDPVINIAASDTNPIKRGFFVRYGRIPQRNSSNPNFEELRLRESYRYGRMNAGPYAEYTDGKGGFHKTSLDNLAAAPEQPDELARLANAITHTLQGGVDYCESRNADRAAGIQWALDIVKQHFSVRIKEQQDE